MMDKPAENCYAILEDAKRYMLSKGITDIRVRGMFMWANGMDEMPSNHFVLIGKFKGRDFVFDLTAGQFPLMDGPLVEPLASWEARYQNTWRTKLIKYQDFSAQGQASVKFSSRNMNQPPMELMKDTQVLAAPAWYRKRLDNTLLTMPTSFGDRSPLYQAVLNSRLHSVGPLVCWDYVALMLRKSNMFSPALEIELGKKFKSLSQQKSIGDIRGLFATAPQTITSRHQALTVPSGHIIVFTDMDNRPVHAMVSIGNGRFVGIKNDALNPHFGSGVQVLTIEQLGDFDAHGLALGTGPGKPSGTTSHLTVYSGIATGVVVPPVPTAEITLAKVKQIEAGGGSAVQRLTDTFEVLGVLSPEQANALKLKVLEAQSLNRLRSQASWLPLIVDGREINVSESVTLTPGALMLSPAGSMPVHAGVYLGGSKFAVLKLGKDGAPIMDTSFSIISADDSSLVYPLFAGRVDLGALRTYSLLGADSSVIRTLGNKVIVRAHGAPGIINHMDAVELSNVVKGLLISKGYKTSTVTGLELQSCWGAFGSYPSGQVMANEFNAPVKAYRWKYSAANADSFMNSVRFEPVKDAAMHIRMAKEHARKNEFWNKFLSVYHTVKPTRHKRSEDTASEDYPVLRDIALLVLKKQSIDEFLNKHRWFWGAHDPDLSTLQTSAFKARMTQALGDIIRGDAAAIDTSSVTINFGGEGFPDKLRTSPASTGFISNYTQAVQNTTDYNTQAVQGITGNSTTVHATVKSSPDSLVSNEEVRFMEKIENILMLNEYIYYRFDSAISGGY